MTKKHFEELARQIASLDNRQSRLDAARCVAVVAITVNPRFDAGRFYAACGVTF